MQLSTAPVKNKKTFFHLLIFFIQHFNLSLNLVQFRRKYRIILIHHYPNEISFYECSNPLNPTDLIIFYPLIIIVASIAAEYK